MDAEKNILVIAPNWVGDTVFFLPAVAGLKQAYPGARLTLLAKKGLCGLHEASRLFDETLALPGGRWNNFRYQWSLRPLKFDLAVVFPDSFSSALGAWLTGAVRRLGRAKQGRGWFLNLPLKFPDNDRTRHVSLEYFDLAIAAGADPARYNRAADLPLTPKGREEQAKLFAAAGLAESMNLVALCPTSAFGPAKCWPMEYFGELASKLVARGFKPVLVGAPDERAVLDRVADLSGVELPVIFPGLPGLAACLAKMKVVVANDSGSLHVAAAVGKPVVGLYGPISPAWSSPLAAESRIIYTGIACSPCHQRVCPLKHHKCLRDISPDEVLLKVLELAG